MDNIIRQFQRIGARAHLNDGLNTSPGSFNDSLLKFGMRNSVRLDVQKDKKGAFFDIKIGGDVDLRILDCKPHERHLLILAVGDRRKSKFLCGHDEREWFVAAIPETATVSTVSAAMEALKPSEIKELQNKLNLKSKQLKRRRNKAFLRQGEWFFLPCPALNIEASLILRKEPLRRGRGKPHMIEELYRSGGETVYLNSRYANGLSEDEFRNLAKAERRAGGFRLMRRNPRVYARGKIRHPDHATIVLPCWHRVLMNTETQAAAMRHVAFVD